MSAPLNQNDSVNVVIKLSGMTCGGCSQRVERVLEQTKGIKSARVDLEAEKGYVEYDPAHLSEEALLEVIKGTGFQGELVK